MLNKNSFSKESKIDLPGREHKAVNVLNRPVLLGILAFVILATLFASLIYQQYCINKQDQKKEAYSVAENAKEKLQQVLTHSLSATRILSFFIDQNGVVNNFDSIAAQILSTNKGIDVLELVPGGVIQHVYPLQGNEKVLGYSILKDSTRSKEAFKAIEKNALFFSGPYDLIQGGFGIVGRLPVFRNGKFWGFSAVVIKMTTLLKAADIDTTGKKGYYFQLSKINPGTGKNEFFITHATKPLKDYATYVELPIGEWRLSVDPVNESKGQIQILILALIGFLVSVFGGIFVTTILRRPEKLEQLVKERTRELKDSEKKYRTIIEQAADGIFIANEQTYLIDVNSAGCIMSGYTKAELQKLKFEDVIPPEDIINNPLRITNMDKEKSGINERRLVCKDGTIIDVEISAQKLLDGHYQLFVRNISERKKAAGKLIENEKKLQQVLSSTVDNFYVIDVNYDVILINKIAERNLEIAWGKPVKQGCNLLDFIPDHGEEPIRENFEKAFAGENIEYEMQLTNPNLPAWVMIRFTPVYNESGKVTGVSVVAKNISERKKAEELLQNSYEDIRQLVSNLQTIREDERTTIAREIHDELGQQLTGLKLDLHWLMRKINTTDDGITSKMKESIELINATIGSVRKISTELRPSILDDLGLLPALEWHGEEFEKRSGTKVLFVNEVGDFTVTPEVATGIFRIYQELLTNIARHASASLVKTLLSKDKDRLYFSVQDNGVGVDTETIKNKKTLGLLGIKERSLLLGGTYEFVSTPGKGAVTTISIPLQFVKNKN